MVPLQLFCDGFVRKKEEVLIYNLQQTFLLTCQEKGSVCSEFMRIPHILFDTRLIVYALFALLLVGDSWLAYKTTLVTGMSLYFVAFF